MFRVSNVLLNSIVRIREKETKELTYGPSYSALTRSESAKGGVIHRNNLATIHHVVCSLRLELGLGHLKHALKYFRMPSKDASMNLEGCRVFFRDKNDISVIEPGLKRANSKYFATRRVGNLLRHDSR